MILLSSIWGLMWFNIIRFSGRDGKFFQTLVTIDCNFEASAAVVLKNCLISRHSCVIFE